MLAQRIVVAILDPWTLQLPEYYQMMKQFGTKNFWNCVVIIPWNEDDETVQERDALAAVVKQLFFGLSPDIWQSQIKSSKEFVKKLQKAFLTAHQKIEEYKTLNDTLKPVSGPGLRTVPGF
jgi:hypothetical protein